MRKLSILYLTIILTSPCFSQHYMAPTFSDRTQSFQAHFENLLKEILKKDTGKKKFEAMGFMRFKIDTAGSLINFECSTNLEVGLKAMLKNCALSIKQRWYPCIENGNKVVSDFLVVPVVISINKYPLDKTFSLVDFVDSFDFRPYNYTNSNQNPTFDPDARFENEKTTASGQLYLPPIFYHCQKPRKTSK